MGVLRAYNRCSKTGAAPKATTRSTSRWTDGEAQSGTAVLSRGGGIRRGELRIDGRYAVAWLPLCHLDLRHLDQIHHTRPESQRTDPADIDLENSLIVEGGDATGPGAW